MSKWSSDSLVWRWELTPRQAFLGFRFVHVRDENVRIGSERRGWDGESQAIAEYPGLTFKVGIASPVPSLHARDIVLIAEQRKTIPCTGTHRSGVLVMSGQTIVGSYTIDGNLAYGRSRIFIDPAFRGRGLARWMVLEWNKRTMRPRLLLKIRMNAGGVGAFLGAQIAVTEWAMDTGKNVPEAVRASLGPDKEYLTSLAARVAATGQSALVRP